MVTRYDVIELKAEVTAEGFIRDKPIITRSGIFKYRTKDGKIKREYRPDSEVFAAESLSSAYGIPVTDSHSGLVTSSNVNGIVGTVTSPGIKDETNVVADVIIHNPNKIGNKRELSLGYTCDMDDTPGEVNGESYDSIQKNIRYNHLAIVNKGRAGNARLRLDSNDAVNGDFESIGDNTMDPAPKLVVIRLDGIEYHASPEVGNALTKEQEKLVALQKRFDTLEAERDSLNTKLVDANKLVDAVKAGARSEVKARLELEAVATAQGVKFDAVDTDRLLKEKVLTKIKPDIKLDGKSDDYVASAFDFAIESVTDKTKKVASQLSRFDRKDSGNTDNQSAAVTARQRMIQRMRGEKVDDKAA